MTEVATLIERVRTLGATLLVHGDTVKVKAPAPLPAVVIEALRQHKQEVMALLQAPPAMPPIPPPPDNPVAEAERVPRIVRDKGVCLLWAEAVKDYVAFALNDEEAKKVPPGYVVYTLTELEALYGPGKKTPSLPQLRMIHQAKKLGGRVVGGEQDKDTPCQNRGEA